MQCLLCDILLTHTVQNVTCKHAHSEDTSEKICNIHHVLYDGTVPCIGKSPAAQIMFRLGHNLVLLDVHQRVCQHLPFQIHPLLEQILACVKGHDHAIIFKCLADCVSGIILLFGPP